jgi:DNA polymerase elongation subunit (family B)
MRILHIDIETAPNIAHVWGLWQQNVSLSQLRESSWMMCFAAKWHGERKVNFWRADDPDMLAAAHELMSAADVLVHYNGKRFDVPTLHKEFLLAGMKPPAPSQQIDLLEVVKRRFRFPSNKLDYVATALGIGSKVKHEGHELWVKCLAGDDTAWRTMERYNKQDVRLLETLYLALRPWITNHPHTGLLADDTTVCPNCGGEDLRREGYAFTAVGKFQRYQCRGCGVWTRSGRSLIRADQRGVAA